MEIWIIIGGVILAFGFIGCLVYEAYENIQMNKWMRQRHLRELKLAMMQLENPEFFSRTHDVSADEIKRVMHAYKTSGVTTTLSTGEVETLGPGKVYFFGGPKVGTVTGTVETSLLCNEEFDAVEKLIKEAKEKKI